MCATLRNEHSRGVNMATRLVYVSMYMCVYAQCTLRLSVSFVISKREALCVLAPLLAFFFSPRRRKRILFSGASEQKKKERTTVHTPTERFFCHVNCVIYMVLSLTLSEIQNSRVYCVFLHLFFPSSLAFKNIYRATNPSYDDKDGKMSSRSSH